jgi:hypothetical protein
MDPETFERLLVRACAWARSQEAVALRTGQPLPAEALADAASLGVHRPEHVRVAFVESVPAPADQDLAAAASAAGLDNPHTRGLALGYGVFLRRDCQGDRQLLAHELVHVSQYERLGGIPGFLRRYLWECVQLGYDAAPLEVEAVRRGAAMVGCGS